MLFKSLKSITQIQSSKVESVSSFSQTTSQSSNSVSDLLDGVLSKGIANNALNGNNVSVLNNNENNSLKVL